MTAKSCVSCFAHEPSSPRRTSHCARLYRMWGGGAHSSRRRRQRAVGTRSHWNPTQAAIGRVAAVADDPDVTVVFAEDGATVLSSGAVLAVDHSRTDWVDAAVIPGVGAQGQQIVGLSADGRLYQLKDRSHFEDISARYGLETQAVRGVAVLGKGLVGFLLDTKSPSRTTRSAQPGAMTYPICSLARRRR